MSRVLVAATIGAIYAIGCGAPQRSNSSSTPQLGEVMASAAKADQPLVVEFGAPWCEPCRTFARKVLPDPRVKEALRTITFVQYDVETPNGTDAAKRCNVAGVPAIVNLDRAGHVIETSAGTAPTVDEFLAFLARVH